MKRSTVIKKNSHGKPNSNGNIDYEDFPEVVPFLEAVSNHNLGVYKAPKKRYRKFFLLFKQILNQRYEHMTYM